MTTLTTTPEAEAYLARVREQLDDLPEEERTDLLEDLAGHLADVTANRGPDSPPLTSLLGEPEQYAAELRSAAGLPPRSAAPAEGKRSLKDRLTRSLPARATRRVWRHPLVVRVRDFVPELQPAWWVLRGYLVIALPALAAQNRYDDFPFPTVGGSHILGFLFTMLAIVGSVWLGRKALGRWKRRLVLAGNAFLVMFALGHLSEVDSRIQPAQSFAAGVAQPDYPLASMHGPVTNIYPYAADGTPLDGVLLFDQDGRPLRTGTQLWWSDGCRRQPVHPSAADGVPVEFSYPKAYVLVPAPQGEPCNSEVARPPVPLPSFPAQPDAQPAEGTAPADAGAERPAGAGAVGAAGGEAAGAAPAGGGDPAAAGAAPVVPMP